MKSKNDILINLSDSIWMGYDSEKFEQFSKPKKVFIAIWDIEAEVNNGGFSQYFLNSTSASAPFVVEALETISAPKTADICRRAIAVAFPDGLPANPAVTSELAADFSDEILEALGELDGEFMDYPHSLTDLLYDYVTQHSEDFGKVAAPSKS